MIKVQGKVVGVERMLATLRGLPKAARADVRKAMVEVAKDLVRHVRYTKLNGPPNPKKKMVRKWRGQKYEQVLRKQTGALWRSIGYEVKETEKGFSGVVFTNVRSPKGFPYGAYWELSGKAHGGPRPFLRPALEEKRVEIRQRIGAATLRALIHAAQ